MVLTARHDLRYGTLYPLSRRDRAHIVWRAALNRTLWLLFMLSIAFSAVGALTMLAMETAPAFQRVPEVVVAIAVTAIFLPLMQWLRLRFIDSLPLTTSPANYAIVIGMITTVFALLQAVIVIAIREADPRSIGIFALGIAPVMAVLAQVAFRAQLLHWYSHADLS